MIASELSAAFRVIQEAARPQAHPSPTDSVAVESPLPGGVATVVRWLLNEVPSWLQITGAVLAVVVGALLLWYLFHSHHRIRRWVGTRGRGAKIALAAAGLALIAGVATMGAATWNYTQHSNDFCTGCHVMNPAFQKFSAKANKHAELSCHDCHQQPLSASVRQLYLWVAERPAEIGEHAKVPNQICAGCHVTGDTARWQHVASTAGHRVHLESDSSALKDVQCVSCHGLEVHRFRPVAETCGQSGCHKPEDTRIVLGKMATQTMRHCSSCHPFTADVPALATTDSARGTLTPGMQECMGCHEMRAVLEDFSARLDPHGGKCGTCHNPHTQKTTAEARPTCAGCHTNWREEPFHVGASHRQVASQCLTCHVPHASKVDASNCEGCHLAVRNRSARRPPLPFDTTQALRRRSGPAHDPAADDAPPAPEPEVQQSGDRRSALHVIRPPPVAADTFSHARHATLACLVCHVTGTGRGRLTFEPPRGCTICHHQAPAPARCARCHQPPELVPPQTATVTVAIRGNDPKARPVDFLHATHSQSCTQCHTTPVTLAPKPALCQDCHTDHHEADPSCASCHVTATIKAGHSTLQAAHTRCDACHTAATVARLTPTRRFCATCHVSHAPEHYPRKECTSCHFLTDPAGYRRHLTGGPG